MVAGGDHYRASGRIASRPSPEPPGRRRRHQRLVPAHGSDAGPVRVVYFSSVSENTHRFVQKLGLPAIRIPLHGRIEVAGALCVDPAHLRWRAANAPDPDAGAMCPSRSSRFEQRTQPIADPRCHRGRQHQLRCRILLRGACRVPQVRGAVSVSIRIDGTAEDVAAVRAGLADFWADPAF